ncbi:hypothetical protein SAMN04515667_0578 [Formosa sp. Hel1_31_208]|uniref:DUF6168 family protein n=1 Tax=Formosa sp. Hel1_31_208 TaxID=1798225 RepID=UPI00087B0894|nr:DUF6168 family protein [Formosa sp. Hel1_31_208]SDR76113.1 hypothetical protein SAMN04515667_0578 [Formosa sp. Hel1_31_208]
MNQSLITFSLKLLLTLSIAFGMHLLVLNYLEYALFENKIVLAYLVNAVLAILIFWFLLRMKEKYKEQLGFLFLAGSILKFAVFFILFYGSYKVDGIISKPEFAAFFVPYLLCLVIETSSLAKWLNKLE